MKCRKSSDEQLGAVDLQVEVFENHQDSVERFGEILRFFQPRTRILCRAPRVTASPFSRIWQGP